MILESFQVTNFRSINSSGDIKVSRITALLGRNESGKSNLLRALQSLNPAGGFAALNPIKDFPRHRRLEECKPDTPVVASTWRLTDEERAELTAILPRAASVTHVEIGRNYEAKHEVSFPNVADQVFDEAHVKAQIRKVAPAVKAAAARLDEPPKATLEAAADAFERAIAVAEDRVAWATKAKAALATLRTALAAADVDLTDKQEQVVVELEELSEAISGDKDSQAKARKWAVSKLPVFIFLDEYPEFSGHQNIAEYLQRKNGGNPSPTDADTNFEKLCKVAGLDPATLHDLLGKQDQETRNQLVNRASAVVTSEIKRLWKDRPLKVRFNLDGNFLDTLISDPNATYDVEVNLDERSRGFKWFYSFYVTFSADTDGGDAANAILLLDEPGLYLHAKSQTDLLRHFETDFANQIVYTTHSPFMVPTQKLDSIRTVNIGEQSGTTVTNDPTGDARTLFPLQAALGYDLAQSLFVGPSNLVVEGVTDFWILSAVSEYLTSLSEVGLSPELTLTPAGGAQKVSYMVALLSSEELNVLVLLDEEKEARSTRDDLVRTKLIREHNVVFVSEAFGPPAPKEADVEDLLDPQVYEAIVRESYTQELKGKKLSLNSNIPRIAKRFEAAFEAVGLQFHKTRPARLLLSKIASDPASIVTADVAARFETLFGVVNDRLKKHSERRSEPFR
ncbi:MAG TPA: AAA family ATPase [Hyphomicrobium sp.]|nr:AAA family ATPase [Hyphomicrobium sp.]